MFCIAHAPNCQISNVGGARMLHMRRYRSKSSRNIIVPPQRILSTSLAARHTREMSFYQHRVNTHCAQHQDAHPGGSLRRLLAATAHHHAQLRARVRIEPSAGPRRARGDEREHPGGPGRGPASSRQIATAPARGKRVRSAGRERGRPRKAALTVPRSPAAAPRGAGSSNARHDSMRQRRRASCLENSLVGRSPGSTPQRGILHQVLGSAVITCQFVPAKVSFWRTRRLHAREGGEIDARQPRNDPALVSQNCGGHVDVQHARMRVREVALFIAAVATEPQSPMDKAGPRLR